MAERATTSNENALASCTTVLPASSRSLQLIEVLRDVGSGAGPLFQEGHSLEKAFSWECAIIEMTLLISAPGRPPERSQALPSAAQLSHTDSLFIV
jgi:hypothetical protein